MELAFDSCSTNWADEDKKAVSDVKFSFVEASMVHGKAEAEKGVKIKGLGLIGDLHFCEFVLAFDPEMM